MTFQSTVNRQIAFGVPGEILQDGPLRALPARVKAVAGADAEVGRIFTYAAEHTDKNGQMYAQASVAQDGQAFLGFLFQPKTYALYGTASGGPLDATMVLPDGTGAQFARMGIFAASVVNGDPAAQSLKYGAALFYCTKANAAVAGKSIATTAADCGKIYAFAAGTKITDLTGGNFVAIPGGQLLADGDANQASGAAAVLKIQIG